MGKLKLVINSQIKTNGFKPNLHLNNQYNQTEKHAQIKIDYTIYNKNIYSQYELYRRLSFQTISAVGAHAAMAHYTPTVESDKQINRQEIYLIDSGTQYKGELLF